MTRKQETREIRRIHRDRAYRLAARREDLHTFPVPPVVRVEERSSVQAVVLVSRRRPFGWEYV